MSEDKLTYEELLVKLHELEVSNKALSSELELQKKSSLEKQRFTNTIASETPDIIYIFNIQLNRNTYINKNLREVLNYPYGAVPEDSTELVNQIIHPDDISKFYDYKELVQSWDHEYIHEYEYRLKDASGKWRWYLGKEREFERQNDKIVSIIGITNDITEWKNTEFELIKAKEEAEKSEERYKNLYSLFRNMADIMPDMIWAKNLENKYIFINNSMCRNLLNAKDTDEPIGKNDMFFALRERNSHPNDPNWHTFGEICRDSDSIVLEKGSAQQFDEYGNVKGKFLFLDVVKTPLKNEKGETIGVVGAARDVTARKHAEEELNKLSELRQILVEISCQYINIPLQNTEKAINLSLQKLAQYVKADRAYIFSINETLTHCTNTHEWCKENISSQIENLQNILLDNDLKNFLVEGKSVNIPNIELMPELQAMALLKMQDIKSLLIVPMMSYGKCIGFIEFDSVTQMHQYSDAEQQLLEVFAEIQVNIINRQTNERELIISKELAEKSNQLKTAFLQNISHEIRTPMNAICGFSDLLFDTDLPKERQHNFISIIQNSSNQLLGIVNDILTISALETNQEKVNIQSVSINELLTDLHTIFQSQANKQNIDLQLTLPLENDHAVMKTDKTKITQIITNLITNALKFTHVGYINFGYKIEKNTSIDKITLFVKDSGIGIAAENHTKIFERFLQANKTIAADYGGTGLGLAISQGFAHLLGGKMWVESELGQGATFFCEIPYVPSTTNKLKKSKNTEPIMKNTTILIAEDEEYNYIYLEELLLPLNIKIVHAKNGKEAIDICEKDKSIELILMDIKMPIMDGYTAAIKLKESNPDLKIIAQTAYALEYEIKNFGSAFDDYLTKPIKKESLDTVISKYMPSI